MIKFKNERKMRKYIESLVGNKITDEQFEYEVKGYFTDFLNMIKDDEQFNHIREMACLEVEIDDESYEVWVKYDNMIVDDKECVLIDLDYTKEYE